MKNLTIITELYLIRKRFCENLYHGVKFSEIPRTGYKFTQIKNIAANTCSFEENEKSSDAGMYFEKKIKFDIARLDKNVQKLLSAFGNNMIVAVAKDANGNAHLVYPLRCSMRRIISGKPTGSNRTEVELSGVYPEQSAFVSFDI